MKEIDMDKIKKESKECLEQIRKVFEKDELNICEHSGIVFDKKGELKDII